MLQQQMRVSAGHYVYAPLDGGPAGGTLCSFHCLNLSSVRPQ